MRIYHAKRSIGSIVVFRLTRSPNNPKEDFYLRLDLCKWDIKKDDSEITNSDSDDIPNGLLILVNRMLLRINLQHLLTPNGISHSATFTFDESIQVNLHPYPDSNSSDAVFSARDSSGARATYLSDGTLKAEQGAAANPYPLRS